ncbi:flotillin family protein [soil metagenome]
MRAYINLSFFVRVNKSHDDVVKVAQTIGTGRASSIETLNTLFEAKFSEALKTVGKKFDFVELYDARERFKLEILDIIGTDLNGYILDDCAIDYLEQTPLQFLQQDNILDAEGIKKIVELTAVQKMKANLIRRDEEKTIKKQDVEAREAILELERQLAEKEEKQKREILTVRAREEAETAKVQEEERKKSENARIATEEEIQIAEENKLRQVTVARKNKERTEAVETERVEKDRMLEVTERERIVTLANIEKEKAVETERRNIQDVIKERVILEKTVVEEEEKIKDLRAYALADREKKVAITHAEKSAEELLVQRVKEAEAERSASEFRAKQLIIEADANKEAAARESESRKIIAEAKAREEATIGLSEAQVTEAKAAANEKFGASEAAIIERKAIAEAKGIEVIAEAERKQGNMHAEVTQSQGLAEADVIEKKAVAEARGIHEKAEAMKKLDGVGKDHEEFKLRLDKEKQVELAQINIQKDIAQAQATVMGEALKTAKIDIVGGETVFFDRIVNAITAGKQVDRLVENSEVLQNVAQAFLNPAQEDGFKLNLKSLMDRFGVSSEDVKNLSVAALLYKLMTQADSEESRGLIGNLMDVARQTGISDHQVQKYHK